VTKNKKVVVYGNGDHAGVAKVFLTDDTDLDVVAFTAYDRYCTDEKFHNLEVIPFEDLEEKYPPDECRLFIAIGFGQINKVRAEIYDAAKRKGYELVSYISSKATRWSGVAVGEGAFIMDGVTIHPYASVGNNVCISSHCVVGHDVTIGDHCFLAPNVVLLGRVSIGPYCFIGASATIRDGVTIGGECVVGTGAVILEDTSERSVYLTPQAQASAVKSDQLSPFFGARRRS